MKISQIFLLSLFLSFSLFAKIIDAPLFKNILSYVDENTLLILDIDDTLMIPKQTLGSDAWFRHQFKCYQDLGLSLQDAKDKALAEWEAIRLITDMELVETETPQIIKKLQDQKIKVMALTTQGLTLAERTPMQLKKLGMDLDRSSPYRNDLYFPIKDGVLYQKGILFTNGTHKGKALWEFLTKIQFFPKKIIFINDKESHLKDVEETLLANKINFIGLRYSFSDKKIQSFDSNIAALQFGAFQKILSDDQALTLLKKKCPSLDKSKKASK